MIINKTDLNVGQWIYFSAQENELAISSEKTGELYKKNNFFLVISREDAFMDGCRCNLGLSKFLSVNSVLPHFVFD